MNRYSDLPILDLERLAMLEKNIGAALQRICEKFFIDCSAALDDLAEMVDSGNLEEARKLAHQMKGASVSLGLPRLESHFRTLEFAAAEGSGIPKDWYPAALLALEEAKEGVEQRNHV